MTNIFKKPWFLVVMAAVLISFFVLLVGGVDMGVDLDINQLRTPEVEDKSVVMTVNGIDFSYNEFKSMMEQVEWEFSMEGRELVEEEVREETINRAIQQAVLIEHARKEGFTPTSSEIEERFKEILEDYEMTEEEFLELIESEEGISTRKEVEDILEAEIMISRLFDQYIEKIVVTDEELNNVYEEYLEELKAMEVDESEFPEMEEMKEFIADNIKYEKATEKVFEKVEELKVTASVKLFLDDFDL